MTTTNSMRIVIAGLLAVASQSAPATAPALPQSARADDHLVVGFLDQLRAGHGEEGLRTLLASSPLWSQKPGVKETMSGQIDAALRAYGPVIGYELSSTTALGTMAERRYYLVQHRDMVVRWEFVLLRTGAGWNVGYFGFSDQPNGWF